MATTKQAMVTIMVSQRSRIAPTKNRRKKAKIALGLSAAFRVGFLRITTPSRGAKRTATIHERISAYDTTTKIENVYSPAELRAKPLGMKPAAVTNEPVSIGSANVL